MEVQVLSWAPSGCQASRAVYNKTERLVERRKMMQERANHLEVSIGHFAEIEHLKIGQIDRIIPTRALVDRLAQRLRNACS